MVKISKISIFVIFTILLSIQGKNGFINSVGAYVESMIEDPAKTFDVHPHKTIISPRGNLSDSNQYYKCNVRPDGDSVNFYYFIPALRGVIYNTTVPLVYSGDCFDNIKIRISSISENKLVINFNPRGKKSLFCHESIAIGTSNIIEPKVMFFSEKTQMSITITKDDFDEIKVNGIKIISFCEDLFTSIASLVRTVLLYLGGLGSNPNIYEFGTHVPEWMTALNVKFLEQFVDYPQVPRKNGDIILPVAKEDIHSGDFLSVARLDGLDPLIMLGTGSHSGHSTVALWDDNDGELYILESQAAWYWPTKNIQKTPYERWVKQAYDADFHVSILPLSEESRKKFNATKAWEFFRTVEGVPYGYKNFLFSWVDTPYMNFPDIVNARIFISLFGMVNKVYSPAVDIILTEALNKRLGTIGLNYPQCVAEAARRGMTFEELLTIVEQDSWIYSDGPNYVCSCFVTAIWQHGGIFDGITIQNREFSPKDIYQLKIFADDPVLPDVCKQSDPDLKHCQILGKYVMTFPGYNSIPLYNNMNEKCPSQAPLFYRTPGC